MLTPKQSIAIKIGLLMEQKTVTQLAKELDVNRTMLSSVISGRVNNQDVEDYLKQKYVYKKGN